jgi:hypothetical protein
MSDEELGFLERHPGTLDREFFERLANADNS